MSIVVSGVGFVVFEYGRRMVRLPHIIFGVALMGFPYFVPNVGFMALVGAALVFFLWLTVKLGW